MKYTKHIAIVAVWVVISTLLLRWSFSWMFALPVSASAEATPIDFLFSTHFWMIAFLFSLIMVIMLYSAVVFYRRPGDETDGPHIHSNTALEVAWTVIPLIVVVGFGAWGSVMLNEITSPKEGEMAVQVIGSQWSWKFAYPEQEGIASQDLYLPLGKPIVLKMESTDVLHSFWVPEFRVKQDLVPGSIKELRITPTKLGDYKVRCAEICGLNHATMVQPVHVVSQEEFDAWVAEKQARPKFAELSPEERGEIWYGSEGFSCAGCHSLDGSPSAGPTWQGIYGREEILTDGTTVTVDDAYIISSILDPDSQVVADFLPNVMNNSGARDFAAEFAEKEAEILADEGVEIDVIADLIAFMQTLGE